MSMCACYSLLRLPTEEAHFDMGIPHGQITNPAVLIMVGVLSPVVQLEGIPK